MPASAKELLRSSAYSSAASSEQKGPMYSGELSASETKRTEKVVFILQGQFQGPNYLNVALTPITFAFGLRASAVSFASCWLTASTLSVNTLPPTYNLTSYFMGVSDRRINRDFFNVQTTELIVDTIEYNLVRRLCIGFLIPNSHTSIVCFNHHAIVFHQSRQTKL